MKYHQMPESIAFIVTVWLVLCLALFSQSCTKLATTQYVCKQAQDEQCPDPGDYAKLKGFQEKYKAPTSEQDEINGLWLRLQQNPPQGMHWDAAKLLYVKNPAQTIVTPIK
jgi:hypothetical protein